MIDPANSDAALVRKALLDTTNALVPGTMGEASHHALVALDRLAAAAERADHRGSCRIFYAENVCTCGADPGGDPGGSPENTQEAELSEDARLRTSALFVRNALTLAMDGALGPKYAGEAREAFDELMWRFSGTEGRTAPESP